MVEEILDLVRTPGIRAVGPWTTASIPNDQMLQSIAETVTNEMFPHTFRVAVYVRHGSDGKRSVELALKGEDGRIQAFHVPFPGTAPMFADYVRFAFGDVPTTLIE
jgi:hypothetical protein